MLTKLMAAVVMAGALWVAGDSLYREFGCCQSSGGCPLSRLIHGGETTSTGSSNCCEVSRKSCCSQENVD